ncbi:MAG TPA: ATP-binding protein [Solirubrobacteraceae bacterium]|jgi:ATP-dependent DNA helicase RecG
MTTIAAEQALAGPPGEVGWRLLELVEDQWLERKSARVAARDLADTLIGFGNAEGGTVVVGLWNGAVEGTDGNPRARNALVQAAMDYTVPPVRARSRLVPCVRDDGLADHLLVIDVEPGEGVVHANTKDLAFLRVGDENRRLSFAQRQELVFDKGQGSFETRMSGSSMKDLDDALTGQYARAVGASDVRGLLSARGLARDDGLTVAGCLLFAAEPQRIFPEAYVRVLRYRGRERGTGSRQQLLEDHRIEGPLPMQILQTRDLVSGLQPRRRALGEGGRFANVGLVPEDAWLEAIVNAVIHRSYSLAGDHTRVEIFDDRIEVTSPGRFPGIVAMSKPDQAPRYARNPRIARVLADLEFGQELGEGIKRMYEEMRLAGLHEPLYRQSSATVHVELSGDPVDQRLDAMLPVETREIVGALRTTPRLSTIDLANAIGLSRPTALKRLAALRDAGVVRWVGKSPKDPRAFWTLPPT